MREYKRVLLLVLIMTAVAVSIGGAAILILYETAISEERQRLVDAVAIRGHRPPGAKTGAAGRGCARRGSGAGTRCASRSEGAEAGNRFRSANA